MPLRADLDFVAWVVDRHGLPRFRPRRAVSDEPPTVDYTLNERKRGSAMYDYNLMLFSALFTMVFFVAGAVLIILLLWGVIAPLIGLPVPPPTGAWPWPG